MEKTKREQYIEDLKHDIASMKYFLEEKREERKEIEERGEYSYNLNCSIKDTVITLAELEENLEKAIKDAEKGMKKYNSIEQVVEFLGTDIELFKEKLYDFLGCEGSVIDNGEEPSLVFTTNEGVEVGVTYDYDEEKDEVKYYYWV